ncbi:arabinofuranosidase catalytic domain-containing protein [Streptomyces sp. RKAG293]|uniref:arabinofuranosidase catalytic domain-containing protein n=1 Tax=Streptomyces sp. RKAG293 TaxID=2893403 RepID=UPI0035A82383
MKKQGAITLGIGGDLSIGAAGLFYEGVMTSGHPSDATENAVQANITSVDHGTSATGSGTGELHGVGLGRGLDVPNASTANDTQGQDPQPRPSPLLSVRHGRGPSGAFEIRDTALSAPEKAQRAGG